MEGQGQMSHEAVDRAKWFLVLAKRLTLRRGLFLIVVCLSQVVARKEARVRILRKSAATTFTQFRRDFFGGGSGLL